MSITADDIQKALRITRAVTEYFEKSNETKVPAKELMNVFLKKGIFNYNHKDGLPIRDFLRRLDENNHLHLIPAAHFEQKDQNKSWFFIKLSK